jgi:hypothetical protein
LTALSLRIHSAGGAQPATVSVSDLIVAGWTGRNEAALQAHVRELAALGIAAPQQTPVFYRVGASLLTTAPSIDVVGKEGTGEVEFILFADGETLLVGLASDHTDRKAESVGITLSKQMCPKPLAPEVWSFAEVDPH